MDLTDETPLRGIDEKDLRVTIFTGMRSGDEYICELVHLPTATKVEVSGRTVRQARLGALHQLKHDLSLK